jgi:aminopeptidase-like protein
MTSADNLQFVRPEYLADSFAKLWQVMEVIEQDRTYLNASPKGEPQLGKRGLNRPVGGQSDGSLDQMSLLWTLNLSDGNYSLLDIAERSVEPFHTMKAPADALLAAGLLMNASGSGRVPPPP